MMKSFIELSYNRFMKHIICDTAAKFSAANSNQVENINTNSISNKQYKK